MYVRIHTYLRICLCVYVFTVFAVFTVKFQVFNKCDLLVGEDADSEGRGEVGGGSEGDDEERVLGRRVSGGVKTGVCEFELC